MAESFGEATSGSGIKWHSYTRTIGANTVHDGVIIPGEYGLPCYSIVAQGISLGTANDHILEIMAGSSLNVRIRRIWLEQAAHATAVAIGNFSLYRLTTAGTGGSSITPAKLDTADSASGATAMTLPSSKGTESTQLRSARLIMRQAILATATQPEEGLDFDYRATNFKPLIIAAGTSNGIAIKSTSAIAGCTVDVYVELVETSFV